jgi:ABC-type glycerol-3-phosphate transport system permease component
MTPAQRRWRRGLGIALWSVFTWALVVVVAFPLIWMVASSFKGVTEIVSIPPTVFPHAWVLRNYQVLAAGDFWRWLVNSVLVAGGTVLIVIIVGTLGAYSLTRFHYPGRKILSVSVLCTYLFPSVLMIVPLFLIFARLRLINTYFALIVADMSFALPFTVWLLRSYFLSVPVQVEEAAMVDGASRLRAFVEIVLAQVTPGIISTAIFAFILAWDDYLFASVFISSPEMRTLPVAIASYADTLNEDWGMLMAASVSVTIPVLVLFGFMQRRLLPDLNAGAVKV